MPLDFISLLLVLAAALSAGLLATRLGMPAILGELAAGMILGPALLGWLEPSTGLSVLAEVGVYLLMLYIGMEIQPRQLTQASGGGLLAAVGGFIFPFGAGVWIMQASGYPLEAGLFMGMAMGVTSLATKSRILVDLNLVGTRIASVLMVGALFSDTMALILFAAILGFAQSGELAIGAIGLTAAKAVLFFGVAVVVGMRVFPLIGQRLQGWGVGKRTANFTLVLIVGLSFGELAHLAGLHGILGAFVAGVFLQEGIVQRRWSHAISEVVHDLSIGFLAPVFFVTAGFHVSFDVVFTHSGLLLGVIVLATLGKILGTALFYAFSGHGIREGLAVGAGMNGRGAVEVVIAEIGLTMGLISQEVFSILVLMAFATTLTVPVLLGWAVRGLRRRGELAPADDGRSGALILGASPAGLAMARALGGAEAGVAFVDQNPVRCRRATAAGYTVVRGNALDRDVLAAAGATDKSFLVSMLPAPATGVMAAHLAQTEFGIPRVYIPAPSGNLATGNEAERYGIHVLLLDDEQLAELSLLPDQTELELAFHGAPEALSATEAAEVWGAGGAHVPIAVRSKAGVRPLATDDMVLAGEEIIVVAGPPAEPGSRPRERAWKWIAEADVAELPGGADATAALTAVADRLAAAVGRERDQVLADLVAREAEAATVIAPGVAVPHILVPAMGDPTLVVARSRQGVRLSENHSPVHVLFAIASDPGQRERYLHTLWAVARLASDGRFLPRWLAADGEAELQAVLAERVTAQKKDAGNNPGDV